MRARMDEKEVSSTRAFNAPSMNRPHTREKSARLASAVTGSGEGNSIDAHNYPTQTLFERVKEEKVAYIGSCYGI